MQPEEQSNYVQSPNTGLSPAEMDTLSPPQSLASEPIVNWQASEYVHHEKQGMWFIALIIAALVLLAVSIFLVHSITFSVLIVAMTITIAVYAIRPPRILNYSLSLHGIQINGKSFLLHDFRSFGIVQDGPLYSAILIPNKRFMPAVNLYFPAEDGEDIVDILGENLPMEHVEMDLIDKIVRRLRF